MTKPKDPNAPPRPKRSATPAKKPGYLVCDTCGRTVESYDRKSAEWPQHRCGFDIRPFTRWESGVRPLIDQPPSPLEGP